MALSSREYKMNMPPSNDQIFYLTIAVVAGFCVISHYLKCIRAELRELNKQKSRDINDAS
jgi:hypothetical protein